VLPDPGIVETRRVEYGNQCIDNSYTDDYALCIYYVCIERGNSMRNAAINLRALPEQRNLIDHAATLLGKNRSDFMLEAACDKAQAVVLDQVFFKMDADKFMQFTAMLDAPPSHNPGLERLMTVTAPWVNAKA